MIYTGIFCVLFMFNVGAGILSIHNDRTGWLQWLGAGFCLAVILYRVTGGS